MTDQEPVVPESNGDSAVLVFRTTRVIESVETLLKGLDRCDDLPGRVHLDIVGVEIAVELLREQIDGSMRVSPESPE